jgi:hypothetical protein
MKVVVLTTSYPRSPEDAAGRFVADAVEQLRAAGTDVAVVSPQSFRHYGIAYGDGVVGNLRRRPWLLPAVPLMLRSFVRAAREAARDADLVHAHWLPTGWVAARTGQAVRRSAVGHRRRSWRGARPGGRAACCSVRGSSSARRTRLPMPPASSAPGTSG